MDIKPDTNKAKNRGETPTLMEPLTISEDAPQRTKLTDLALELAQRSMGLSKSLPEGVRTALADLVRSMNCYYSNLIEGHNTHPIDIERALNNDYSANPEKRDLQLEAKAHISVQRWIDAGNLSGQSALTAIGISELHKRFCEQLPEQLLWLTNEVNSEKVKIIPGEYREHEVQVGRHIAISPGAIPRFMTRFEAAYKDLGRTNMILAAAAAHHRLSWIHPFTDGNGRVMRLMSYAILRETLDTGGIWSIARGLARHADEYKEHLAMCDLTRRNDLDGRGNLSQEALIAFTQFFLQTCIDQVKFMEELVQPDHLHSRIKLWAEEEVRINKLAPKAIYILEAILYKGTLPRGDVAELLNTSPRQARRVVSNLMSYGVITAETTRSPLRLSFPAHLATRWMPGLFPEKT